MAVQAGVALRGVRVSPFSLGFHWLGVNFLVMLDAGTVQKCLEGIMCTAATQGLREAM